MRISVFGLGYVGCVSAGCLARDGHEVLGVDVNPTKVELVAAGRAPILEPGLDGVLASAVKSGRLRATTDASAAVEETQIALVCVGTPSAANGSLSTDALERVSDEIGASLRGRKDRFTVVYRSTMVPGTTDDLLAPILERSSGMTAGDGFGVAANPEFLREGSSVSDFDHPPKLVIGQLDDASGDAVAALYGDLPCATFRVPVKLAELVKYVDNAFHALKVGFANEIGAIARQFGIDSHVLMEIFRSDTKLNISPAYLSPGFAFGGSCLPKDLRALVYQARRLDLSLPILENVLVSNEEHLRRTIDLVAASGRRRVGIFGLAFKAGTDELRESPLVELSERLLGKGYDLRIFDPHVSLSRLVGTNRAYIETHLPHLAELLADSADDVLDHADVCIVGSTEHHVVDAIERANGRVVIDLVRLPGAENLRDRPGYIGVGW